MTRKRSKDDWRKKRRQEYLETREYRYYIFTEGIQTEPLHFQYYTPNTHRDEYRRILRRKIVEVGATKYDKNVDQTFDVLLNHGNPKLAIRYAKRILRENEGKTPTDIVPGTRVHELVEELAKYLPEEIKSSFL